jgi:hypothetical protein
MNDKIYSKLQKLLARADEDRNDNEHERAVAMRQAEKLMAQHNLSMGDLKEAEYTAEMGDLSETVFDLDKAVWTRTLASGVAKLYSCKVLQSTRARELRVIGRYTNVCVMMEMYHYLVRSIRRQAEQEYDGWSNRISWNTSFGNGASAGVWQQVQEILAARERAEFEGLSKSDALVVLDQQMVQMKEAEALLRKLYPRLQKAEGSVSTNSNGFYQGKDFGSRVSLQGQVGASGGRQRLTN